MRAWLAALTDEEREHHIDYLDIREKCYDVTYDNWDKTEVERECTKEDEDDWLWHKIYYNTKYWGYVAPKPDEPSSTEPIGWYLKLVCDWKGFPWQAKDSKEAARRFQQMRQGFDEQGGGYEVDYNWLCRARAPLE